MKKNNPEKEPAMPSRDDAGALATGRDGRLVKTSVEGDYAIRFETDLTNPNSCYLIFVCLYLEMERMHGAASARTMAQAMVRTFQKPDSRANDRRNAEWMTRFRNSRLSIRKFAAQLAEENRQLAHDKEQYLEDHPRHRTWLAMRAGTTLLDRGPWGSTSHENIERHIRRLGRRARGRADIS